MNFTSKYNFKYYYCKVKTSDGDYKKDITTGESDLNYYDLNNDGKIDVQDLSIMLIEYSNAVTNLTVKYDLNEDGQIDLADISILLSSDIYGTVV